MQYRTRRGKEGATAGSRLAAALPIVRETATKEKTMSDLVWLTGVKNRVLVLAHWTTAFLSRGHAERAITEQQVFGRQALSASRPGRRGR
jgi:hypothetical protein